MSPEDTAPEEHEPPEEGGPYGEGKKRRKKRRRNTELVMISWIFVCMFGLLAANLVYIQVRKAARYNSSAYNTKKDAAAGDVIRGSIVTEGGESLAYTEVDWSGNENRIYPYGRMFAHTVGYATNGKGGLEATENKTLMTAHTSLLAQLSGAGEETNEKKKGDSIVVTLNPRLQAAAWYGLGDYRGAVVILEPGSGKILAMVSKPDFDPGTIGYDWENLILDENRSPLLNRATSGLYPPGSIFKILTTLAYLREHGDVWEDYSFNCEGTVTRQEVTITCYNSIVHGMESLKSAFANSCNTSFATIGLDISNSAFRKLAETFLFDHKLPTDLDHSKSLFTLTKGSGPAEQMTTAIGQGQTLVTPLHMAMIAATVANAGTMMKPYMISRVVSAEGETVSENSPQIYDELMSVQEASILSSFMQETVNNGTGTYLSGAGYSVAGKTGSAEYETGNGTGTHSWFVGFTNVDNPDLAIAIIAEDGGTGSSTAVPIARAIFDNYYYG